MFRASFYWGETTDAIPHGVPIEMTEPVTPHRVAMKGTTGRNPRCIALEGVIGDCVSCSIHAVRSSVCREFPASYSDGAHNVDCDRARARYGMRALTPADWLTILEDPDRPPSEDPTTPRPRVA